MKKLVARFLLVFIIVAVATKIVLLFIPREPPVIPDGNHLVLCRSAVRCPACKKMEFLIKQVLTEPEYADIGLVSLEYDMPENKEFAERFRVGTLSVILLEQKNGEPIRSCDISEDARNLIRYNEDFVEMLKTELNEFYGLKEVPQIRHGDIFPCDVVWTDFADFYRLGRVGFTFLRRHEPR